MPSRQLRPVQVATAFQWWFGPFQSMPVKMAASHPMSSAKLHAFQFRDIFLSRWVPYLRCILQHRNDKGAKSFILSSRRASKKVSTEYIQHPSCLGFNISTLIIPSKFIHFYMQADTRNVITKWSGLIVSMVVYIQLGFLPTRRAIICVLCWTITEYQ